MDIDSLLEQERKLLNRIAVLEDMFQCCQTAEDEKRVSDLLDDLESELDDVRKEQMNAEH